jgi:hypothetical protein
MECISYIAIEDSPGLPDEKLTCTARTVGRPCVDPCAARSRVLASRSATLVTRKWHAHLESPPLRIVRSLDRPPSSPRLGGTTAESIEDMPDLLAAPSRFAIGDGQPPEIVFSIARHHDTRARWSSGVGVCRRGLSSAKMPSGAALRPSVGSGRRHRALRAWTGSSASIRRCSAGGQYDQVISSTCAILAPAFSTRSVLMTAIFVV